MWSRTALKGPWQPGVCGSCYQSYCRPGNSSAETEQEKQDEGEGGRREHPSQRVCSVVSKVAGRDCRDSGEGGGVGSEEEEERAAEAQGREAVWDEGDGTVKGEVLLCRLSEGDVG